MHQQIDAKGLANDEPEPATDLEIQEELDEIEGDQADDGPALRPIRVESDEISEHDQCLLEQEFERIDLTRLEHAVALIAAIEKPTQVLEAWQEMPEADDTIAAARSEAIRAAWDYVRRSFTRARV